MTTSGTITKYPLKAFKGGASDDPQKIIVGPDGNLWFTEYAAGKVGKITTSGTITEYSLPEKEFSDPTAIAVGPDKNLWVTGRVNHLWRITTSGEITEYTHSLPEKLPQTEGGPTGITAGPDGNLWISDGESMILKMNKEGEILAEYELPAKSRPSKITPGPEGNLWFDDTVSNRIGTITMAGKVTEYPVPMKGVEKLQFLILARSPRAPMKTCGSLVTSTTKTKKPDSRGRSRGSP